MSNNDLPPVAYKATGNLIPISFRKTSEDFALIKKELGKHTSTKHGGTVFTNFKLYYKKPDWENPNFTIKMQLSNKANGSSSAYASMPLEEFSELLSTMIKWLYTNKDEIQDFQEISRELLRRHKIEEQRISILKDLSNPTDQLEDEYLSQATINAQNRKLAETIKLFYKYFKSYFETDNSIHKRQCLDFMLTLLPEHTEEVLNLISNYSYSPESVNNSIPQEIEYLFQYSPDTFPDINKTIDKPNIF